MNFVYENDCTFRSDLDFVEGNKISEEIMYLGKDIPIEIVDPHDLKPHPSNPRKHTEKGINYIGDSIEDCGFVQNVVVRDGIILIGHARVETAKKRGWKVPVVNLDHLTEHQANKLLIMDNAIRDHSKWDRYRLAGFQQLVNEEDEYGLVPAVKTQLSNVRAARRGKETSEYAYDEKDKRLDFDVYPKGPGKYQIPVFEPDYCPTDLDTKRIKLYFKKKPGEKPDPDDVVYWWILNSDALPASFPQRVICAFYREDNILKPALRNLEKTSKRLWFLNVDIVTTPDISIVPGCPAAALVGTLYERQRLSVVLHTQGTFKVIPDLIALDKQYQEIFLEGFPNGLPVACASLQTSGVIGGGRDELRALFAWSLRYQTKRLGIKTLIVYGGSDRDKEDLIPDNVETVIEIPPFRSTMAKKGKKGFVHGDRKPSII